MSASSALSLLAPSVPRARRVALACVLATAVGPLLACTGDHEPAAGSSPTTTATEAMRPNGGQVSELRLDRRAAPHRTEVTRVWGRWPGSPDAPRTRRLAGQVGGPVRSWLDRSFVEPDYPTQRFTRAFEGFTGGAAALARRQESLTTNRAIGSRLVDAVPTRRAVHVTAFAPQGRAVGATANVTLVLQGLGGAGGRSETVVTAQLSLTRVGGAWRVFGFEVGRRVVEPGTFARERGGGR